MAALILFSLCVLGRFESRQVCFLACESRCRPRKGSRGGALLGIEGVVARVWARITRLVGYQARLGNLFSLWEALAILFVFLELHCQTDRTLEMLSKSKVSAC